MCQGREEKLLGIARWYFPLIIRNMRGPKIIVEIVTIKNQKSKVIQKETEIFNIFLYMQNVYIPHLHVHNVWLILTSDS